MSFPQPSFQFLERDVPYLTLVTLQRAQLHIKGFGDIGAVIDILSSPEQYLFDLMRIEPFFRQIRVGKDIPGIGEDGIQGNLSGYSMIPVPNIASIRISSNNGLRPIHPDEADDLFTELRSIFQALIGMAEENDLPHAQQVGCSDLFLLPSFG